MVPTVAASAAGPALNNFTVPNDSGNTVNKIAMSIHVYAPHLWAHNGESGTYTNADTGGTNNSINGALTRVRTRANALGLPVVFGEFGSVRHADRYDSNGNLINYGDTLHQTTTSTARDTQRRLHAYDYINWVRTSNQTSSNPRMAAVWWDTGRIPTHQNGDGFTLINRAHPHTVRLPSSQTQTIFQAMLRAFNGQTRPT
jgi:hypothetical protein